MEIRVLKTFEINPALWGEIVEGFNTSFTAQKNIDTLKGYYLRTRSGYSYHALAFEESGILAGYNSLIPILYTNKEGIDFLTAISGGTYVIKEYRNDVFIFSDMVSALLKYASKEGIVATMGVSNKNSFQYALKFLNSKLISFLPYYGLPVRIFNVLKIRKLFFLNFISVFSTGVILRLNLLISKVFNASEKEVQFELKTDDQFFRNRFGNNNYSEIRNEEISAFYRIVLEEGIKTAYLFDFRENNKRSSRALYASVKNILDKEKPDLILFIGHLRLRQFILFRIPRKFEPQPLPLTFNITSAAYNSYCEVMSNKENWNFGLMNFDAR